MIFSDQQRFRIRNKFVSLILIVGLGFAHAAAKAADTRKPAPVIDAAAQSAGDLEARLEKIERRLDSQSMMDVLTRLDRLQQEMQNIVGQMELLNHEMNNIKKRQKDLYVDIDRRITQVEQKSAALAKSSSGTTPAMAGSISGSTSGAPSGTMASGSAHTGTPTAGASPATGASMAVATLSPQAKQLQREAYDRAFNLLKNGRYELAIASFKAYLETYPDANYADNAQYWLGEANYAQRRYDVALQEFNKVLDNYPKSAKRADAMLKMGFSYQELGKREDAEAVLSNIISMFPDTTAARLAQQRIQDLRRH